MKILFAGLFFIISVFLSFSLAYREWYWVFIGLATFVGFLLGQVLSLSKDLEAIRRTVDELSEGGEASLPIQTALADDVGSEKANANTVASTVEVEPRSYNDRQTSAKTASLSPLRSQTGSSAAKDAAEPARPLFEALEQTDTELKPSLFDKAIAALKSYFVGGNLFVRIGIIILFLGVSFLLKYVSDRGFFPIEYRLIGVVIGAMVLLALGWRLRNKNEAYALLLQGAGIGILYLDIFAAFSMYQLIPSTLAFILLFVVSMFSAALAVLQNSKSLAVLGFSGGFLSPILASSGSNNHVGLFSYYAVLNMAIVVIAWFKAWRPLNLLGFAFTFIIGTAWGSLSYDTEKFSSTEPFLILFFLFYVLIAVLFALRQPPKLKGYVDGTLLFGVPLAFASLQYYLVKDFDYGVSMSSFAVGAFYLFLSWFVWQKRGDSLKLLSEAFLALGVIFASMAIPYALAPTQTAAAWAVEGAGFIWLGTRQNRLSVRGFGVLLQLGAGLIYVSRLKPSSASMADVQPFINGEFISTMMLAVAGIVSARLLYKAFEGKTYVELIISPILLVWGLIWMLSGYSYQIYEYYSVKYAPTVILLFIALLVFGFTFFSSRNKPEWKHAWFVTPAMFVIVILMAFMQIIVSSYSHAYHPAQYYGWLAWPVIFAAFYFSLWKMELHQALPRNRSLLHSAVLVLLVGLVTIEGALFFNPHIAEDSAWMAIWLAIPATVAVWVIVKGKFWPFSSQQTVYRKQTAVLLSVCLLLWSVFALIDVGSSDPIPWMPLLNPLDVMLVIIFITLIKWWQSAGFASIDTDADTGASDQRRHRNTLKHRTLVISTAAFIFAWLNVTLFRVAHHWFDVPYNSHELFHTNLLQSAVSILWALSGVLLLLYSSRKHKRLLWIIGAIVLAMVVIKLFLIDLSALGSLGRVISFIVVGVLFTSIGYFAPLPNKTNDETEGMSNA